MKARKRPSNDPRGSGWPPQVVRTLQAGTAPKRSSARSGCDLKCERVRGVLGCLIGQQKWAAAWVVARAAITRSSRRGRLLAGRRRDATLPATQMPLKCNSVPRKKKKRKIRIYGRSSATGEAGG